MENTGAGFDAWPPLIDTIHGDTDRHGCAWDDVNLDGLDDIYCTKGAGQGTETKYNELWIQGPEGTFTDLAAEYGVTDPLGRGRLAAFLDLNHDPYPDLFVGNETPRRDGQVAPNRTFVNLGGTAFMEVNVGLTREVGADCVQVVDIDRDGEDDLLLCGRHRLFLFIREEGRFVQRARALGVDSARTDAARIVPLDADDDPDLVLVRNHRVSIRRMLGDGTFSEPVADWDLRAGEGLAVGDVDGLHGNDVLAVEGCVDGLNVRDSLLVNRGGDAGWDRQRLAANVPGCGDVAASLDFDLDGMDDFLVMNGRPLQGGKGPDQLLTAGTWGLT
jgi:hypothetical protein